MVNHIPVAVQTKTKTETANILMLGFLVACITVLGGVMLAYGGFLAASLGSGGESTDQHFLFLCDNNNSCLGEYGSRQASGDTEYIVGFLNSYSQSPVVIAQPLSRNDKQPAHVRITEVTPTYFRFKIEKWDYLASDRLHGAETINFFVVPAGTYTLDISGAKIEAGFIEATDQFQTVFFPSQFSWVTPVIFSHIPVVLAQLQESPGSPPASPYYPGQSVPLDTYNALVSRVRSVSSDSFQVRLQAEEAHTGPIISQRIGYIALSPIAVSVALGPFAVATQAGVSDEPSAVTTDSSLGPPYVILADMQTTNESDPASLRYTFNNNLMSVMVEEEQSADSETNHAQETVGYIIFGASSISCGNGIVEPAGMDGIPDTADDEFCDDGNTVDGDGCGWQGLCRHYAQFHPQSEIYVTQESSGDKFNISLTVKAGPEKGRQVVFENLDQRFVSGDLYKQGLFTENVGNSFEIFILPNYQYSPQEKMGIANISNSLIVITKLDQVAETKIFNRDLTNIPGIADDITSVVEIIQTIDPRMLDGESVRDFFLQYQRKNPGWKIHLSRYPAAGTFYSLLTSHPDRLLPRYLFDSRPSLRDVYYITAFFDQDLTRLQNALMAIPFYLHSVLKGMRLYMVDRVGTLSFSVVTGIEEDFNPVIYSDGDNQAIQVPLQYLASLRTDNFIHELSHVIDAHYLIDAASNDPLIADNPPWEPADPSSDFYRIDFSDATWDNLPSQYQRSDAVFVSEFAEFNEREDFAETFTVYITRGCDAFGDEATMIAKLKFMRDQVFNGQDCSDFSQ